MRSIKAITMVRNDVFLKRWVEYYGRELGRENLYIFFDGKDQTIPDFCKGTNTEVCCKMKGNVVELDRTRAAIISAKAAELLSEGADMVIGTDADEFLVADPALGLSLREILESQPLRPCYSALGVDVIHHLPSEGSLDFDRPFLSQRHRGWLYSRYTKASVITEPLSWGSGFHRVRGKNFHIIPGLYLFHFGAADLKKLDEISADPARVKGGWTRHQQKRRRAIERINRTRAHAWDSSVRIARTLQKWCRPIFALNKPTTFGIRIVAEIPYRFNGIV